MISHQPQLWGWPKVEPSRRLRDWELSQLSLVMDLTHHSCTTLLSRVKDMMLQLFTPNTRPISDGRRVANLIKHRNMMTIVTFTRTLTCHKQLQTSPNFRLSSPRVSSCWLARPRSHHLRIEWSQSLSRKRSRLGIRGVEVLVDLDIQVQIAAVVKVHDAEVSRKALHWMQTD
jgi:hypothetical protein